MKSISIQAKRFELEEQMHRFVSAYLQRTANFVAKNQIDEELHQDILQRLADKLSDLQSQGKLDQKYIIQTINDLGEAEDIFAEELDFQLPEPSFQKEEKSLTFYERLQAKGRSRPQQKALFLGIYAMIADLIGWNVRMVRGIGLFLHFAFSAMGFFGVEILLSVPMYFALALILPRKEKDYYHRSVLNYFLTQMRDLRLLVINFFRKVWQLLCFLMPTKGGMLSQIFFFIWNVVRFVVLGIWTFGLLFASIGLLVIGFYLWTGMQYGQTMMDFSVLFPAITKRGVLVGIVFLAILAIGGFGAMFRRTLLSKGMRWTLVGTGIFSAGALVITVSEVGILLGTPGQEVTQELTIPLAKKQNLTINLTTLQGQFSSHMSNGVVSLNRALYPVWQQQKIHFTPTTGNSIKAIYYYTIQTSRSARGKEHFAQLVENLKKPSFEREGDNLEIGLANNEIFDQQVAWAPVNFRVELQIPQNVKFTFTVNGSSDNGYLSNLVCPERKWKNSMMSCSEVIRYSAEHNAFYCPAQMTKNDKKNLTSAFIYEHIDELVAIKGLEPERSFSYDKNTYRKIHSIDWKAPERPFVKVSDKFLNIFVQLEAAIDQNGKVTILKNEILDIEKKGNLTLERLSKYQGLESMSDFLVTVKDKKGEIRDQIQKLEQELELLEDQEE